MTAPDKPGLSNEELKPCPMNSCHPFGPTEVRELMPDYWMVQCLTAQHHVSVSGYKTKELAIEAWNRRAQSPPVAQVEVYRKALESAEEWMAEDGCDCGTDEPGTCGLCLVRALLTSKPEPVAKVCPKCGEPMQNHNDTKCDMRYATECPICHLPSGGHNTILHRGIQEPSPRLMAEIDQAIKDHAPVAQVGPYGFSKHYRYCGPGLDRMPDHVSVLELNIAYEEGRKSREPEIVHLLRCRDEVIENVSKQRDDAQALLTSKPEPVAPICPECKGAHVQDCGFGQLTCMDCQWIGTGQAPVAPVRKWEPDDSVVKENWTYEMTCPECDYRWDEDCVLAVRDCLPEVQDALNGRKV